MRELAQEEAKIGTLNKGGVDFNEKKTLHIDSFFIYYSLNMYPGRIGVP